MDIADDWDDMNQKSLVIHFSITVTWNAPFTTSADDEFALVHIREVYASLVSPEVM